MYIEELYNAFYELKETSSRIGKEDIMRRYGDNKEFKETLKFLVDPMVITGISTKKMQKYIRVGYYETEPTDYDILDLLEYAKTNNTGRDSDIAYIQHYIWKLSDKGYIQDFIEQVITKSFKPGVDVKICQKVYGKDFIPTLNVMLGKSIENCTIPDGAWISISQKLNGNRCFYYKGKLYTRQGKEYTGCEHILLDIKELLKTFEVDYVFDGELILKEDGLTDSEAFQKGTGIANSKDKDKSNLKLIIFDLLPTSEFESGKSKLSYNNRRYWIDKVLRRRIYNNSSSTIDVVDMFYEGYDHSEIEKWLKYAEENDMEGIMVNLDAPYEGKRTKNLIKVKKFYTYDLKCIGVEEGTGKHKGRLGAIVVDFKGNPVSVGSGFTDALRESIWNDPNSIIGKVIEVKYKEVTKNKDTGAESLQFPVFVGIREEDKEISYE